MRTHLDLFSGIGGFAIAAQRCGYTTVAFCEKEPYAQQILKERFGAVLVDAGCEHGDRRQVQQRPNGNASSYWHEKAAHNQRCRPRLHENIFTLNGADYVGVDILTGGFPCQPFSVAGKRRGAEDDRAIWPEMLRVIDEARPAWVLGENVAGIINMELDNILSDLECIGYAAWPLVIPACAVDARHRRDRVWIVANADEPGPQGRDGAELRERGGERFAWPGDSRQDSTNAGQPEPAILRMADGLPERLDCNEGFCQWPQEDSETPRVTTGIKHRAHRLRGLGNAIVPQVAEMILREISRMTDNKP